MEKEMFLSFFGLMLSLWLSDGFFKKISSFVREISATLIPFAYEKKILKEILKPEHQAEQIIESKRNSQLNKTINITEIRGIEWESVFYEKILRIQRSVQCNGAILMTIASVTVSLLLYIELSNSNDWVKASWYIMLIVAYVYICYFLWRFGPFSYNKGYWRERGAKCVSRYNSNLTIGFVFFITYGLYLNSIINIYIFVIVNSMSLFVIIPMYRIPVINNDYRKVNYLSDIDGGMYFYLKNAWKEKWGSLITMIAIIAIDNFTYEIWTSIINTLTLKEYIQDLKTFSLSIILICLMIPIFMTFIVFVKHVTLNAFWGFLVFIPKKTSIDN